jgi:hypothetical protein
MARPTPLESPERLCNSTGMPRPSFAASYAKAFAIAAKKRGWRAYLPLRQILSLTLGAAAAYFMPQVFWLDEKWEVSAAVMGGMLAFNGLLLAIGWSAFSKIHDIISEPEFSAFLKRYDILDIHMMFVDGTHFALAAGALASFAALIGVLLPLPLLADQILFAITVGTSVNSVTEAFRASEMMNDLIWDKAHSNSERSGQSHLRPVGNGK